MKTGISTYVYIYIESVPPLIKPPLIINDKSRALKIPHEHFKRGCTTFKRGQTIMN